MTLLPELPMRLFPLACSPLACSPLACVPAALLLLAACSGAPDSGGAENVVDMTLTEGLDYPAPTDADLVWDMPAFEVAPYTETQMCFVGTYTGEDAALVGFGGYQQAEFGHHVLLLGTSTSAVDLPDGTFFDCTRTQDLPMDSLEPLILPTKGNGEQFGMALPTGIATKLRTGQRWILQVHNVNTTADTLKVNAIGIAPTIPMEDVVDWAAPWTTNRVGFTVPPHSAQKLEFNCTFDVEYHMLYLMGHMHEWGTHFKLEMLDADGAPTTMYEQEWDPSYRDTPPIVDFSADPLLAPAGTTWRTTCEWFNDTDDALEFPSEMCASVSMVYPALTADICSD